MIWKKDHNNQPYDAKILAISAHAASARTIDVYPSLAFNGTSATCTVTILGERTTDRISAVMELWQGNILIDDWSASASGILKIDETATVERNKTYKLTVNYTVNGVAQTDCRLQGYAIDGNMATRTDSNNSTVTAFFYELPSSGCWRVVQVLFQLPQRGLVRLLRTTGSVVVEIDRQFLKGHANLVRLANAVVTAHQIQLSGRQHLLHPLHQQHPTHEAVIGNGGVAAAGKPRRPVAALGSMKSRLLKSLS